MSRVFARMFWGVRRASNPQWLHSQCSVSTNSTTDTLKHSRLLVLVTGLEPAFPNLKGWLPIPISRHQYKTWLRKGDSNSPLTSVISRPPTPAGSSSITLADCPGIEPGPLRFLTAECRPLTLTIQIGGAYRTRTDQARILQGSSGCPCPCPIVSSSTSSAFSSARCRRPISSHRPEPYRSKTPS